MRKDTGFDLTQLRSGNKLCRARVVAKGSRIADQSGAVRAAEGKRIVSFGPVALGAAFHSGIRRLVFPVSEVPLPSLLRPLT